MQTVMFDKISCNKKLFLDRNFEELTLESIQHDIEMKRQQTLQNPYEITNIIKVKENFLGNNIFQKSASKIKVRLLYYESVETIIKKEYLSKKFKFKENNKPNDKFIDITAFQNSRISIHEQLEQQQQQGFNFFENLCCYRKPSEVFPSLAEKDTVLIHIHGGGFVATSSYTHQLYTRRWANSLKIPIISIDYRLSPEYFYPAAFDDCWQVYCWVLFIAHNYFSCFFFILLQKKYFQQEIAVVAHYHQVSKIEFYNCFLDICYQAIIRQIKVPDGLFLAYPALNLNANNFTPSYMYSITDSLLSAKLLKIILQAYIPENLNYDINLDFFLTPLTAPDSFLKKLPPVRMIVGEKDPLSDDSFRLVQRLLNLNKHVRLILYKYMAHGFLNFDFPIKGVPQSKICIQDAIDQIKQLFEISKTQ